jgi:hypothetical protein
VVGWILLTPLLSKWLGTGLTLFVLTPVLSHLLTLVHVFDFAGGRPGELLVDQLQLLTTRDQRSKVVLQPHTDGFSAFGDNRRGQVLSVSIVKVSDSVTLRRVALVKSVGFNLFSVSQLLDEGFKVRFKTSTSRVLDS